jgi:hypothetical protein
LTGERLQHVSLDQIGSSRNASGRGETAATVAHRRSSHSTSIDIVNTSNAFRAIRSRATMSSIRESTARR